MDPSEVSPMSGKMDDPRVTGKKRKAQQTLPTNPNLRAALLNLASHLQKSSPSRIRIKGDSSDVWHVYQKKKVMCGIKVKHEKIFLHLLALFLQLNIGEAGV